MKSILKLLCTLILIFPTNLLLSQADIAGPGIGHQRLPGRYVGWSPTAPGSVPGPLDIRNDFGAQPIRFYTGGAAPANLRMAIMGAG